MPVDSNSKLQYQLTGGESGKTFYVDKDVFEQHYKDYAANSAKGSTVRMVDKDGSEWEMPLAQFQNARNIGMRGYTMQRKTVTKSAPKAQPKTTAPQSTKEQAMQAVQGKFGTSNVAQQDASQQSQQSFPTFNQPQEAQPSTTTPSATTQQKPTPVAPTFSAPTQGAPKSGVMKQVDDWMKRGKVTDDLSVFDPIKAGSFGSPVERTTLAGEKTGMQGAKKSNDLRFDKKTPQRKQVVAPNEKGIPEVQNNYYVQKQAERNAKTITDSVVDPLVDKIQQDVLNNVDSSLFNFTKLNPSEAMESASAQVLQGAIMGAGAGSFIGGGATSETGGWGALPGAFLGGLAGTAAGVLTTPYALHERSISEQTSPSAIWDKTMNEAQMKKFSDAVQGNIVAGYDKDGSPIFSKQVQEFARRAGKTPENYVNEVLFPQIATSVEERYNQNMDKAYRINGFGDLVTAALRNATFGLNRVATQSLSSRQKSQEAYAKATTVQKEWKSVAEGKEDEGLGWHSSVDANGQYHAGLGARLGATVVGTAGDVLSFKWAGAMAEGIAPTVTSLVGKYAPFISKFTGKGAQTAESFLQANLNGLPQYVRNVAMALPESGANLGTFMGTSGALNELAYGDNITAEDFLTTDQKQRGEKPSAWNEVEAWLMNNARIGASGYEGVKEGLKFAGVMALSGNLVNLGAMQMKSQLARGGMRVVGHAAEIGSMVGLDWLKEGDDFEWSQSLENAVGMKLGLYLSGGVMQDINGVKGALRGVMKNGWHNLTADTSVKAWKLTPDQMETVRTVLGNNGLTTFDIARIIDNGGAGDAQAKQKFMTLFDPTQMPWDVRQKLGMGMFGNISASRPIYDHHGIQGDRVNFYSSEGELIRSAKFSNAEELQALVHGEKIQGAHDRFMGMYANIRNCPNPSQEMIDDAKTDFIADKVGSLLNATNEDYTKVEKGGEWEEEFNKFLHSNNYDASLRFIKDAYKEVFQEGDILTQDFWDIYEKIAEDDPRTWDERTIAVVNRASDLMKAELDKINDGIRQPEVSVERGKDDAEKDDLTDENATGDALADIKQKVDDCENAFMEAQSKAEQLLDSKNIDKNTSIDEGTIQTLVNNGMITTDEAKTLLDVIKARNNYENAIDEHAAYVQRTAQKINEAVDSAFAQIAHRGTINGEDSQRSVYVMGQDKDGNVFYVLDGNVGNGRVTSDSDMVLIADLNGNIDYMAPDEIRNPQAYDKTVFANDRVRQMQEEITARFPNLILDREGNFVEKPAEEAPVGDATGTGEAPQTPEQPVGTGEGETPQTPEPSVAETPQAPQAPTEAPVTPQPQGKFAPIPDNVPNPEAFEANRQKYTQGKIVGSADSIRLSDGEKLDGHYVLTASDDLVASHDAETFKQKDGMPTRPDGKSINDRDYEHDREAQQTVRSHAANYDERAIQEMPVVTKDGIVVSGNDRTMSGQLAGKNGTDKEYVQYLLDHAEKFGLKREDVQRMIDEGKHPRVVLELDENIPYTTDTYARFNKTNMKKRNVVEEAVAQGKVLREKPNVISAITALFDRAENLGDIYSDEDLSKALVQFLEQGGVITKEEMAEWLNEDGMLSDIGKKKFETIMTSIVLDEDSIRLLNNPDYKLGKVRQNIAYAIAELMRNERLGDDYKLLGDFNKAIELYGRSKGADNKNEAEMLDWLINKAFTDDGNGNFVETRPVDGYTLNEVILALQMGKGQKAFKAFFKSYNDQAKDSSNGQTDMFGGGEVLDKDTIINQLIESIYGKDPRNKQRIDRLKAYFESKEDESPVEGDDGAEGTGGVKPTEPQRPSGEVEGTGAEGTTAPAENGETPVGGEHPVPRNSELEAAEYKRTHPLNDDEIDKYADGDEDLADDAKDFKNGEHNDITRSAYEEIWSRKQKDGGSGAGSAPQATDVPTNGTEGTNAGGKKTPTRSQAQEDAASAFDAALDGLLSKDDESTLKLGRTLDEDGKLRSVADHLDNDEARQKYRKVVDAAAQLGYQMIKDGLFNKEEWKQDFTDRFGEKAKRIMEMDDQEWSDFLDDVWANKKIRENGERKSLNDWAEHYKNSNNENENNNGNESETDNGGEIVPSDGASNETDSNNETEPSSEHGDSEGHSDVEPTGESGDGNRTTGGFGGYPADDAGPADAGGNEGGSGRSGGSSGNPNGGESAGSKPSTTPSGTGTSAATGEEQGATTGHTDGGRDNTESPSSSTSGSKQISESTSISHEKVAYKPRSKGKSLNSVVPAGLNDAMQKNLAEIGDVDEYVREALGYDNLDDMYTGCHAGATSGLAGEQIDGIALAVKAMRQGYGAIIADQTGLGKGRQAAGILRYAMRQGMTPVFFTEKASLYSDLYRDMVNTGNGSKRPFIIASNIKNGTIEYNGKIINLPSDREYEYFMRTGKLPKGYDYAVCTYSQIFEQNGVREGVNDSVEAANEKDLKLSGRRKAVAQLCKNNIVVFDESHNAAGADSSSGRYCKQLVKDARGVTFFSATYAKRPDNMAIYAMRSVIGDANIEEDKLLDAIKRGGPVYQEVLARELAESGALIRRERNMEGVTVDWEKSVIGEDEQRATYDKAITTFRDITDLQRRIIDAVQEAVIKKFGKNAKVHVASNNSRLFNVTNQLFTALKVEDTIRRTIEILKTEEEVEVDGKKVKTTGKVFIPLHNTNDALMSDLFGNDTVIAKNDLSLLLERCLNKSIFGITVNGTPIDPFDLIDESYRDEYTDLASDISLMNLNLSLSPIDALMEGIKAAGYKVGEITGRGSTIVKNEDGDYVYKKRERPKNNDVVAAYNDGDLDVVIVNDSGSTGLSMHASKEFKDQRKRHCVTLQAMLDVNTEMQIRGRVDRTGQLYHAAYSYLVSHIPAENRLMMMLKAKLKSLDAQTTASQKSEFNDVDTMDIANKYGSQVIVEILKEDPKWADKLEDPFGWNSNKSKSPDEARENYIAKDNDYDKVMKRIALLTCSEQEELYEMITERYSALLEQLDATGMNDLEIKNFPLEAETKNMGEVIRGEVPGGKNTFADSTYVEEVEANNLDKPFSKQELKNAVSKTLNGRTDEETRKDIMGEIDKWADEQLKKTEVAAKDRFDRRMQAAEEKLREKAEKAKKDGKTPMTEQEIQEALKVRRDAEEKIMNDNIDAMRIRLSGKTGTFREALKKWKIGTYISTFRTVKQGVNEHVEGVVVGFDISKGHNPATSFITLASSRGQKIIKIPFSDAYATFHLSAGLDAHENPIEDWDSIAKHGNDRETRYIYTGNLLGALIQHRKGQLVNYTEKDGTVRQGLLLPRGTKLGDIGRRRPFSEAFDKVKNFYKKGHSITTSDKRFTLKFVPGGWNSDTHYELRFAKNGKTAQIARDRGLAESAGHRFAINEESDTYFDSTKSEWILNIPLNWVGSGEDTMYKNVKNVMDYLTKNYNAEFDDAINWDTQAAEANIQGFARANKYSAKSFLDVFNKLTTDKKDNEAFDPEIFQLGQEVFKVAEALGIKFSLGNTGEKGVLGYYDKRNNEIRYKFNHVMYGDKWEAAETVLHEAIHGVTAYAFYARQKGKPMSKELAEAVDTIIAIQRTLSDDSRINSEYGIRATYNGTGYGHEAAAEMSNRGFREKLKSINLWEKFKQAVGTIITTLWKDLKLPEKDETAFKRMNEAIYKMLDNFDVDLYHEMTGDNYLEEGDEGILAKKITPNDKDLTEDDKKAIDELNNGKTKTVYRAMQVIDGKLYPPMAAKIGGELVEGAKKGDILKADEHPEYVTITNRGVAYRNAKGQLKYRGSGQHPASEMIQGKDGKNYWKEEKPENEVLMDKDFPDEIAYKFILDKGGKDATGKDATKVPARYNPYWHTSNSPMNDQFKSAWIRPNMVVVECEIPESELTSGYKAQYAKDAVGMVPWKSGSVTGELVAQGHPGREVYLSRYCKIGRTLSDAEAAKMMKEFIGDKNVEIPENVVTPKQRVELEKLGVKIGAPEKGVNKSEQIKEALEKGLSVSNVLYRTAEPNTAQRKAEAPVAVRKAAADAINALGGKGHVHKDEKSLPTAGRVALAENPDAMGWYDKKTGEVHIYLPNCPTAYDAEKTVLHEKVGHEGLRKVVGEENYKKFLMSVWEGVGSTARHEIAELASKFGHDYHKAVDEWLAQKAENFDMEKDAVQRSTWQKIKDVWNTMMHKLGFKQGMSEKDIRRAIWLSRHSFDNKPGNFDYTVRKAAFEDKLRRYQPSEKVSKDGRVWDDADEESTSYRTMTDKDREARDRALTPRGQVAQDDYEDALKHVSFLWTEAFQNAGRALQQACTAILGRGKEIDPSEDCFSLLNQLGSKNKTAMDMFGRVIADPLTRSLGKALTYFDGKKSADRYKNLQHYVYAKHALERNRVLAVRDYLKTLAATPTPKNATETNADKAERLQTEFDDLRESLKTSLDNGTITLRDYYYHLDDFIKTNMMKNWGASKHDVSGISDTEFFKWGTGNKGEYDDAAVIEHVMNTEAKMGKDITDELWNNIGQASQFVRDNDYESGFHNSRVNRRMESMFSWYVPLRGFSTDTAEDMYYYMHDKGNHVGKAAMKAKGRISASDTPIETLLAMGCSSIMRGNRNRAKQALVRFVRNHPNNLITEMKTHYLETQDASGNTQLEALYPDFREGMTAKEVEQAIQDYEADIATRKANGEKIIFLTDKKTGTPYRIVRDRNKEQHFIHAWINGKDVTLIVHGNPRASQYVNGDISNYRLPVLSAVNSFMSQLATSKSLTFMARNSVRDYNYATSSILATEGLKYNLDFQKMYWSLSGKNIANTLSGATLVTGLYDIGKRAYVRMKDGKFAEPVIAHHGVFNSMRNLFVKYKNGTLDMSDETEKYFKEFVDNGGMTGYTQLQGVDEWKEEIENTLKQTYNASKMSKVGRGLVTVANKATLGLVKNYFNLVDAVNEAAENQARFACYYASRKAGRKITRAVDDAKRVSVNFNLTGAGSATMKMKNMGDVSKWYKFNAVTAGLTATALKNTMWFFNAGVQGMSRTYQMAMGKGTQEASFVKGLGKAMKTGQFYKAMGTFAAWPFVWGFVQPILSGLAAAAWDDDDDRKKYGKNPYIQLPEYVRRDNFCMYIGHGRFAMLPWAIETRALYAQGDLAAGLLMFPDMVGEKPVAEQVVQNMAQMTPTDIFGGSKAGSNDLKGGIRAILMPDVMEGVYAAGIPGWDEGTNVGWTGTPISYSTEWNKKDPKWQHANPKTGQGYINFAKMISKATGGDDVTPGKADLDPSKLEYLVNTYGSGPAKDVNEFISFLANSVEADGKVEGGKVPVLKAVYRNASPANSMNTDRTRWYAYRKEYEDIIAHEKTYARAGRTIDTSARLASGDPKLKIAGVVNNYKGRLKALEARKNKATTRADREMYQDMINETIHDAITRIDEIEGKKK